MKNSAVLYEEYEGKMQRTGLFKVISEKYTIKKALYSGSYIHISPSFYISEVVYVDTDKKAIKFFKDDSYLKVITKNKTYSEDTIIRFHPLDYQHPIPEEPNSFDLLVSQYAGFVSQHSKKYLRDGGILIANNSHGDAGVANLDIDFRLIGVINYRNGKFTLSEKNLSLYFIPKKSSAIHTKQHLLSLNRGMGYKKTASHYLFKRS